MLCLLSALSLLLLYGTRTLAVSVSAVPPVRLEPRAFVSGPWGLTQPGTTGVSAMQLAVTSESTVIILDKVLPSFPDHYLQVNITPYCPESHRMGFRAQFEFKSSSFLGNGTLVSSGGNPIVLNTGNSGLQAIRLFTPCTDGSCDIFEDPNNLHLTSNRWYPSSVRIDDGSVLIYGGSTVGGFQNGASQNNPTYEFFPPKNINGFNGVRIPSQFLKDTLNGNHFPILMMLPDGNIFVAANQQAMLLNWKTNTERRLPNIPNGVRITYVCLPGKTRLNVRPTNLIYGPSSPYSAGAVLLPLKPDNDYTPEVMICGGSTISDKVNPSTLSSQTPASDQCARMVLNTNGINAGWSVETMPQARIMPELILLPDGRVVIINGAQTGVAGYGNVGKQVGSSNADNPALSPVLYDPNAAPGNRFSSTGISSQIARIYHSTATLTPSGNILVAGSNPNGDVQTRKYPTEYRFEYFSPPYMSQSRPSYTGLPATVAYGSTFKLSVQLPDNTDVSVALIDLGFATHGVHMDHRFVQLESNLSSDRKTLTVTGPPSGTHYPPGPAYLYVVTNNGVPSIGHKTLVGTGTSPPVDVDAIANMRSSARTHANLDPPAPSPTVGEGSNVADAVIPI
ncbi:hypothetical protein D9758_013485 [Tetrapyrgos nigripes]|uniref:Glyoxal oxidase n=1 Tax=Tetrapyrgos nigripes TaxID=182062 RepID=A0A8H5FRZ1_9AGAR|nr:hypothetical protein D9758_013485 [Tetrapyrgos nigripes]